MTAQTAYIDQLIAMAEQCHIVCNRLFVARDTTPQEMLARFERLTSDLLVPRVMRTQGQSLVGSLSLLEQDVDETTWRLAAWALANQGVRKDTLSSTQALERMAPLVEFYPTYYLGFGRTVSTYRFRQLERDGLCAPDLPWSAARGKQICIGLGRSGWCCLVVTCPFDTSDIEWVVGAIPGVPGDVLLPKSLPLSLLGGLDMAGSPLTPLALFSREAVDDWVRTESC